MNNTDKEEFIIRRLELNDLTENTSKEVKLLFEQLNASIDQLDVRQVISQQETVFVACWDKGAMVGIALMATYKVISGHKGMIEDVVVNEKFRGKGIGKKLIQFLLDEAKKLQLSEILLFSGHHRKAAISLYTSLGFVLKDSGLYRLPLN